MSARMRTLGPSVLALVLVFSLYTSVSSTVLLPGRRLLARRSCATVGNVCRRPFVCKDVNTTRGYQCVCGPGYQNVTSNDGRAFYCKPLQDCPRPGNWCAPKPLTTRPLLKNLDCDKDGIGDWICMDKNGARGAIVSSRGCNASDTATGWPSAPTSLCPPLFRGPPCARPPTWCTNTTAATAGRTLLMVNCDGDGTMDWVCVDRATGERGVLLSSTGCSVDASGWPNAPASMCPTALGAPPCNKPGWWCSDNTTRDLFQADCDGDLTPDWVCLDRPSGARGALLSSTGCVAATASGWPNAAQNVCPSVFKGPPCARPSWWCSDNATQILLRTDCDGDATPDWVCMHRETGARGALLSSTGCNTSYASGWPMAAQSVCPSVFDGPPCARPSWWCSDNTTTTRIVLKTDCDGDPTPDWVCMEPATGARGVLLSSTGCNPLTSSGSPMAPQSACPTVFKGPPCARPSWWCANTTQFVVQHVDCDGDATLDWVCEDPATGARGALLSSTGCDPTVSSGSPMAPQSACPTVFKGPPCARPSWWCANTTQFVVRQVDCDGDPTPDWVCEEPATGARKVLLSSNGCNMTDAATGWPNAPASMCPNAWSGPTCALPSWWCPNDATHVLQRVDCDGDGALDWVCTQPAIGARAALLSSTGCNVTATGSPNAPASMCPSVFPGPPCALPSYWCTNSSTSTRLLQHVDCDGDATLDWVCEDPATGARGVLLSSTGCNVSYASGSPNAPQSACPAVFQGPPCALPSYWCANSSTSNKTLQHVDCDGDATLDWVCEDPATGARGVLLSSTGCNVSYASGSPNAPQSACPAVFQGPPCALPSYWCTNSTTSTRLLQHVDCDGDATLDWICTEPATGNRGVLLSSTGCDTGRAGWPLAPASACPAYFA